MPSVLPCIRVLVLSQTFLEELESGECSHLYRWKVFICTSPVERFQSLFFSWELLGEIHGSCDAAARAQHFPVHA